MARAIAQCLNSQGPFYTLLFLIMKTVDRLLLGLVVGLWMAGAVMAENWPAWRGPHGDGASHESNVPFQWSETQNILWKVPIPGVGHASPIVWEDRLFLVTADLDRKSRDLLCLDLATGKSLWRQVVLESPLERKHNLNSFASSTPATDGRLIYTAFLDQEEMVAAAYDFKGNRQWLVRPGIFHSMHGFCSSPVLFEEKVILNGDHDGDSYLVALDRTTGKTLWKTPRPNKTRSYCVPTIFELSGRTQMILSGDKSVASYDPRNGKRHWYMDGPTEQFVASIVYNPKADLLMVSGGYPDLHILGLRHDGRDTLGDESIRWRTTKGVSYVPSPISEGDYFLIVSDAGIGTCFEAATGKIQWQERLEGGHHASLVSAEGRVYFLGDNGLATVVKPGPFFEVLARNKLDDHFFASPAISNKRIYLRGEHNLYCVGQ